MSAAYGDLDEQIQRLRKGGTLTENEVTVLCEKVCHFHLFYLCINHYCYTIWYIIRVTSKYSKINFYVRNRFQWSFCAYRGIVVTCSLVFIFWISLDFWDLLMICILRIIRRGLITRRRLPIFIRNLHAFGKYNIHASVLYSYLGKRNLTRRIECPTCGSPSNYLWRYSWTVLWLGWTISNWWNMSRF